MSDPFKEEVEDRIAGEEAYAGPGTRRGAENDRADAQQSFTGDLADGFQQTAIAGAARVIGDEATQIRDEAVEGMNLEERPPLLAAAGQVAANLAAPVLAMAGVRAGEADYDKAERFDELTKGIPYEYHHDIMGEDNFLAASRARARIQEDLKRGQRISQQDSGALTIMAASLVDADLPLMFVSGGAYGSAKLARTTLRAANTVRMSPNAAIRASGLTQGLNAGLQAGLVVGAVDNASRETVAWQEVANMALMSTALGGAISGATKGDVRASMRAAQDDFYQRIARDDRSLTDEMDIESMDPEDLTQYFEYPDTSKFDDPGAQPSSVGAAQAGPLNTVQRGAVAGASPTNQNWITAARNWRHDSGWGDSKAADDASWWGKVANHQSTNLTTNNFKRLYQSDSAVANYIAGTVFESAGGLGRGRATASIRMDNYHRRIQRHLGADLRGAQSEWAKQTGHTWQNTGKHISEEGKGVFNREVMLELNDRAMGRGSSRNPEIKKAADQYERAGQESLNIGRGREGETAIDGFEGLPDRRGYTPYKWSGSKIRDMIKNGRVTQDAIVTALADGYRKAGMGAGKDADAVAKAVIHRAMVNNLDMDTSVMNLMTGDGKDFLRESMITGGLSPHEADSIMDRLIGAQHEKSKEGYAKSRNDIDMNASVKTADGSDVRIVDLFDNDLHGIWQRYTRQVSGSASLARHGITNRAKRKEIIDAMRAEQRALGEEPIQAELLEAMFSHFNAGPVHGYGIGKNAGINEGIGQAALVKRIANLGLLEKLGVTQLAETGVMIAQNGVANWMVRGPMAVLNKELKAGNKEMLDDMAFYAGEIGQDHWAFAPWLDLDDTAGSDKGSWLESVNKHTSVGSFVQGYTSAFNHVRSFQQQTAALGVSDKIFREIKKSMDEGVDLDDITKARFNDMGIDAQELEHLISSGIVEFKTIGNHTFVNRLNMNQWDAETGEMFASAVTRNINQVVQKSMAGEQDAWMHTVAGSVLMHLKTFPLQAIQKQVVRQAKFMDKEALATVLMGLATAAVASKIRDTLDGRERDALGTVKSAFNYSNMTGWIPFVYDPVMTMMGMDEARINAYGPHYDLTPPTIMMANNLARVPGAVVNKVQGDADWYDQQAIKALPFMGTYVLSRMFD